MCKTFILLVKSNFRLEYLAAKKNARVKQGCLNAFGVQREYMKGMITMLKATDKALNFRLNDADGNEVSLDSFTGKRIVLYFYPKDDTPGCTIEANGFKDGYDEILETGSVVVGVSPDGQDSHCKFRDKFELPFHLLSDTDHSVAEAYGAWGEKNLNGKKHMGILRSTFIIDENQEITHVFPKVSPKIHAEEILRALGE